MQDRLVSTPSPSDQDQSLPVIQEKWYYPQEIANDLDGVDIPERIKQEIYACAWEYVRCVVPQYTNWNRYIATIRVIIIAVIAEFKGSMVQVAATDDVLGYNLSTVLAQLFKGTRVHAEMARELRCCLLFTGDKASSRREGLLFQRYVTALAQSPRQWFRMRGTDALLRFTIAAALACNDLNDCWLTEEQSELLSELGCTLYDSIAFFKHRSEGETNSKFAYVPPRVRIKAFHQCRQLLWALDVAWVGRPEHLVITNFLRFSGGPIHMMVRRYRFVEDGMTIGHPDNSSIMKKARQCSNLWGHRDTRCTEASRVEDVERYKDVISRSAELMFEGLSEILESSDVIKCQQCQDNQSHEDPSYGFGGVRLCAKCQDEWTAYVSTFPDRFANVFPEVKNMMLSQTNVPPL
ncbi:uncharacterized protein yc1106_05156 [Curvularia clavata]|uniref:Uncharacterized protein n=1 Tax=Curvularia clavata TaxID=95742 RepID=A0A9Q8Z963_CURCL|nr:uncharacterized protein yc1106_05156 [Curvularia clavata]